MTIQVRETPYQPPLGPIARPDCGVLLPNLDYNPNAKNKAQRKTNRIPIKIIATDAEIVSALQDLRAHGVDMVTIGQYLAPSAYHTPVLRYVHPDTFSEVARHAYAMGFSHVASGPMVRSSYHADQQAHTAGLV